MIEINHLVKKYGNEVAVDDLNLKIESGKIYGFLGPNGAGKSTTMNILTGYIGATSGEVKINGYDIVTEPEKAKKCIGYLPEIPPLYTEMTVNEYMDFVAELKQIERNKRKMYIQEAMEITKLFQVKNKLIRNLSKGYRQRVGLAQAVLGYPEVIILDEPTVGLDPKQIIEIRELIKTLGEKHTVILSSHILTEISEVCDHIFIIAKGKLVASDTTENLMTGGNEEKELKLSVKASANEVKNVLSKIHQLDHFECVKGNEAGITEVTIKAHKGQDLREEIFYAFAEQKLPIYKMILAGKTLETIFLELTTGKMHPLLDSQNETKSLKDDDDLIKKDETEIEKEQEQDVQEQELETVEAVENEQEERE